MLASLQKAIRLLGFFSTSQPMSHGEWSLKLSKEWDVLGPFPISAREQHFLSPAFPLELSVPYRHQPERKWLSSYADGGQIGWSRFNATDNNHVVVSFPTIRWSVLRATEGWAALQHHNVLHTTLTVTPPPNEDPPLKLPRLAFSVSRASFFTLIPTDPALSNDSFTPEWNPGDIYETPRSPKQLVNLPRVSLTQPTSYDLFISGDYEIRLFGDPMVAGHAEPVLDIGVGITLEPQNNAVDIDSTLNVKCDFVDGWAFGTALGIGIRVTSGWWDVLQLDTLEDVPLSLSILHKQRLAPTQSRIIPVQLAQNGSVPFYGNKIPLSIRLFNEAESRYLDLTTSLEINHRPLWGPDNYEALRATYFLAGTPTLYRVIPPLKRNAEASRPPILALHGAGVDIEDAFWPASLPRQLHSWIICPAGRTSWGFDWHGPSADDVWGSLAAHIHLLASNATWAAWNISENTRVVIIGHSNGGQGTWHLAARYPDRVIAAVPASAYIKAQQYIPLSLSRGYHFVDPSLRAILDASMTPDDNDLFLSNLVDTRILAIHGGNDENVPTWHSRQMVDIVKSWKKSADISFHEDPGKPHWYPEVLKSLRVQNFLSSVLEGGETGPVAEMTFTLTVATPRDSGFLNGMRIDELEIPGRLGRLQVVIKGGLTSVRTTNVRTFSIEPNFQGDNISVDGTKISPSHLRGSVLWIQRAENSWKGVSELPPIRYAGPLSQIMRSPTPLSVVFQTENSHSLSIATRFAHAMLLYFRIDVELVSDVEASKKSDSDLSKKDFVIIGSKNSFGNKVMRGGPGLIVSTENGFSVNEKTYGDASIGLLFLHPHLTAKGGVTLFLWGTDSEGLERAARLVLPMRTGVALPEFIIIGSDSDTLGVGGLRGAGFWNRIWGWSDTMSWLE